MPVAVAAVDKGMLSDPSKEVYFSAFQGLLTGQSVRATATWSHPTVKRGFVHSYFEFD